MKHKFNKKAAALICGAALAAAWFFGRASSDAPPADTTSTDASPAEGPDADMPEAVNVGTITVRFDRAHQTIDGFGGSNAWASMSGVPAEVVELLFSRTGGIGLTILRNRIPFRDRLPGDDNPSLADRFVSRGTDYLYTYTESRGVKTFNLNWSSWDLSGTKTLIGKIKALDDPPEKLTVMSSPWTPPNNRVARWKPDVKDWAAPDVGGHLAREKYEDYADLLADYANGFEANMGVPLDILSVQNEPNWEPDYESCKWSAEELTEFIKVLGARFLLKCVKVQVMAPEDENLRELMAAPILANPEAAAVISVIGLHQYEGAYDMSGKAGAEELPGIWASGKRLWQTEVSGSGPRMPAGDGIENGLFYGRMIHYDMTLARTNAFLYWWLWQKHDNAANPGSLIKINGEGKVIPSKRFYVFGQYSRFIRPGWVCVESDTELAPGLYSSAYRSADSTRFAVVLINEGYDARSVDLALNGVEAAAYEIYRTSAEDNLRQVRKDKTLGAVYLAPRSVTTVYGY